MTYKISASTAVVASEAAVRSGPQSESVASGFLFSFLLLVLYEGALRKWLFPGYADAIYFLKDLVLVGATIFLTARGWLRCRPFAGSPIGNLMVVYVVWISLETFNPASPSLALSLFGAKGYLLYIVLIPLCMAAYKDSHEAVRGLQPFFIMALPIFALGVAQFYSPASSPINQYVRQDEYGPSVFGTLNRARVSGTFSYITGMSTFLFAAVMLSLAFVGSARWKAVGEARLASCVLLLSLFVTPMTGSRWSVYILGVVVPALWVFYKRGGLGLMGLLRIGLVGLVLGYVFTQYGQESVRAFQERAATTGDAEQRYRGVFLGFLDSPASGTMFGYGVGSTHQAAATIVRDVPLYSWIPDSFTEDELTRVAVEDGLIGLVATLTMRLALFLAAYRCALRATNMKQLFIAGTAVSYLLAYLFSNSVFNSTAGAFYWLYVGLLAVVWREQRAERINASR